MTAQIFAIIAPVFLIAALGYGWARFKMPFDANMVSTLVFHIGAPCLLMSQLLQQRPNIVEMSQIVLAAMLVIGLGAVVGLVFLKSIKQSVRTYLPALIFPNGGNMGMPLCLFAFGEAGFTLSVAYFAGMAMLQFSAGQAIASGRFPASAFFANPVLWALGVSITLISADIHLPVWVMDTITTLSGFVIPLMLMSLGISLAQLSVHGLGKALMFSVFRLGGGFLLALGVVSAMDLEGPARGVVLIQSAMPTAVFNYLFAVRYNNRPEDVAGIVLISTLLSFATLPLLLAYVLAT